mmetsp:Transcript_124239/g.397691  ORF Transcript_124239/g.397691 Transcript_124239/m.397691 type:complete len:360 (+) Transcript_124239:1093-2172(+)
MPDLGLLHLLVHHDLVPHAHDAQGPVRCCTEDRRQQCTDHPAGQRRRRDARKEGDVGSLQAQCLSSCGQEDVPLQVRPARAVALRREHRRALQAQGHAAVREQALDLSQRICLAPRRARSSRRVREAECPFGGHHHRTVGVHLALLEAEIWRQGHTRDVGEAINRLPARLLSAQECSQHSPVLGVPHVQFVPIRGVLKPVLERRLDHGSNPQVHHIQSLHPGVQRSNRPKKARQPPDAVWVSRQIQPLQARVSCNRLRQHKVGSIVQGTTSQRKGPQCLVSQDALANQQHRSVGRLAWAITSRRRFWPRQSFCCCIPVLATQSCHTCCPRRQHRHRRTRGRRAHAVACAVRDGQRAEAR